MRKITRGNQKGTFNDRELEVIRDEVLKDNRVNLYNNDEIGVTTPYRMQANNIQKATEKDFSKCCSDYSKRQQEFHNSTIYINSWLACQRLHEEGIEENHKIVLSDFKISKLFCISSFILIHLHDILYYNFNK